MLLFASTVGESECVAHGNISRSQVTDFKGETHIDVKCNPGVIVTLGNEVGFRAHHFFSEQTGAPPHLTPMKNGGRLVNF